MAQNYNPNDLLTRTAVAACALACKATKLGKKIRQGSAKYCELKNFEIAVAQLNCIRHKFDVLLLPATSTITVSADGGTDTNTTLLVNGVTISDPFLYDTDNETTASGIADAINNLTSTPDYTATSNGATVTIIAVTKGAGTNGYAVASSGGDVTMSLPHMTGGQEGNEEEDNALTEAEVEHMFNNIAEVTGCCYAPLGYGYESSSSTICRVNLTLNTGGLVDLNAGGNVQLNKKC